MHTKRENNFRAKGDFFLGFRVHTFFCLPLLKGIFGGGELNLGGGGGGRKPQNSKTKTAAKANKKVSVLKALAGTTRGQDQETLLITH